MLVAHESGGTEAPVDDRLFWGSGTLTRLGSAPTADVRGARGSNAGDQFHELWALEQVLALLDSANGLAAVTVEGVTARDRGTAGEGPYWDGVDCALYFGGDSFASARRVELVQLKYSSDPDRPWSIARLTASSARRGNNSVLRKLANAFSAARSEMQATADLRLRLVSNQPVDDAVIRLVEAVSGSGQPDDRLASDLERVTQATALRGAELASFLASLDFSECGRESRFAQRERVTLAVAQLTEDNATSDMAELQQRVRELMLPERHRERVKFETVLSWFGIADPSGLFPCPAQIPKVEKPILRDATRQMANALVTGQRLVCLHGPAGCGKTTALQQVSDILPDGSCLVLFDCYGAGRYLYSDQKRHLPEHAFLQIANDLALVLRTPFFLARGARHPIDIRQFLTRVTDAAVVLAAARPDAMLVLVVDAADNAVTAALRASPPEPCFVHELCRADIDGLPANVRIVLSARTARVEGLQVPSQAVKLECPPFSLPETSEYAHRSWPAASDPWIAQFHHLSSGIPRVQDYAVNAAGGDMATALDVLRPGGKGLNDVLRVQFEEALRKIGIKQTFDSIVGGLAVLPPPIPPAQLAAVAGTSSGHVNDLVNDLHPGLRSDEDGISIADEDFDDFIKNEAKPNWNSIATAAANHFHQSCRTDPYAATHVAQALVDAGRGDDLLRLVEDDTSLQVIADPIVRREVLLRRLRLALRVCRNISSALETLKVILISADANKEEAALREMLQNETDLGVHFAWPTLRRLVLTDRDSAEHQGSVLAQAAARAAHGGDRITARERLASHEAWLQRRNAVPQNERRSWTVSVGDIVARAEAILETAGVEAVVAELQRWRPRTVRLHVALELVPALIASGRQDIVNEVLDKRCLPEPWNLLLSIPLAMAGQEIDRSTIARSLGNLTRHHVPKGSRVATSLAAGGWEHPLFDLLLTACELAVALGVARRVVLKALRLLKAELRPQLSPWQPVPIDGVMRIWLLERHLGRADMSLDAFLRSIEPKSPGRGKRPRRKGKRGSPASHDDRHEELKAQVQALFPIYRGRLALITGVGQRPSDEETIRRQIPGGLGDYRFDSHMGWTDLRDHAATSVVRLMALPLVPWAVLYERAVAIRQGRHINPLGQDVVPLLEYLLLRSEAHSFVLNTIVAQAAAVRDRRQSSTEKVESFVRFSRLLLRISPKDAESLFASAVELTKEIDREAYHQIELLACLSKSGSMLPMENRREEATRVFRFVSGAAERLSSYEGFPWEAATRAVTRLSVPVALAAVARWADDGTVDLQTALQPLLVEALALGELSPSVATALAILLDKPDADLAQRILSAAQGSGSSLALSEELAHDCLLHASQDSQLALGERILSPMDGTAIAPSPWLARLEETIRFLGGLPAKPVDTGSAPSHSIIPQDSGGVEPDGAVDLRGRRFTTPDAICEVLDLRHPTPQLHRVRHLLVEMRKATALRDRIAYLEAVSALEHQLFWEEDRAAAVLDALDSWNGSPGVDRWRRERLPRVIVRRFGGLARWIKQGESCLARLMAAAPLPPSERLRILTDGIEASGLELGAQALYGVAEMIAANLADDEAAPLLTWYIERLARRIPVDAPAHLLAPNDIPATTNDAVARFLFAFLGDIDTRLRWPAAHALRRLARLQATDAFDAVLSNWNRTEDKSFRDPEAPYYWLAARLWLVMAISRIAGETPSAAAPHLELLARIATDPDLPHVLIREHAKRAVLRLVDQGLAAQAAFDPGAIGSANMPRLPRIRAKRPIAGRSRQQRTTSDRAFQFDSWDTPRYWYEPLLDLFPRLDMDHFLDRAEDWILGRWGAPRTATWWDPEPRKGRYKGDHPLWDSSHGGLPIVERYGTYLEWHAMLCVVGELLETHALSNSREFFGSFEEWLSRLLPTEPDHWISDSREPTPLETRLWAPDPRPTQTWLRGARTAEFVGELGVRKPGRLGWIVVQGHHTVRSSTHAETVSISSALVSPDTASALVRALQTVRDPGDFRIPSEDDWLQIDAASYRLTGWLAENAAETHFDKRDPLRHEATPLPWTPGRAVCESLGLTHDHGTRAQWTASGDSEPSFAGEVWCDIAESEDDHGPRPTGASGWRLWMRTRDLQAFLVQQNMHLICEVQIERHIQDKYSRTYDPKKRRVSDRILLCRRDGRIEGAAGRLGSWTTARRRAQP